MIQNELTNFNQRFRREFDETEAYLRHRERVHEREKREKLKKQGKLDKYLREKVKEEPLPETKEEVVTWDIDDICQRYKETKKLDEEGQVLKNYSKFDVDEKKVELIVNRIKRKKKIDKAKKARRLEQDFGIDIEEPEEFKPPMAGQTGLPKFFFNNLVNQNRSAFQKADARNRMFKCVTPKG